MTLTGMILKAAKSADSINKKYFSPPPELEIDTELEDKIKRRVYKYRHVQAKVDSSPPSLQPSFMIRQVEAWKRHADSLYMENMRIVTDIKRQHFTRGKVDSRWRHPLKRSKRCYENRVNFLKRIQAENKIIYNIIITAEARVVPTKDHLSSWAYHRRTMIAMAEKPFILFPPVPSQHIEDPVFRTPDGVHRPRVHLLLGIVGAAALGEVTVELFTDVCPLTCRLFLDLADGDGLGHGYVGTCFYTKVPGLYWSGGDVIYNNGFGCYAQRGRSVPIGAENYHFPHSMPGLLSMRMTRNDEMCGTFNITFKALPQFDLKNVVFGRIIRPSSTYSAIRELGSALSTQPVVEVRATRRRAPAPTPATAPAPAERPRWLHGQPNLVLQKPSLRSIFRKAT